jgi:ATP-dependent RNA helicase RhlE
MSETFATLGVSAEVERALAARGINTPFRIQTLVIPDAVAGRDILGQAPTGSGKTLAFGLPIVELLSRSEKAPAVLVLVPTRELALQVTEELTLLGEPRGIRTATAYGGAPVAAQAKRLKGAHVVVATPGRLIDLARRRLVSLDAIRILVLDEADRMLDMGFIRDIRKILAKLPPRRQTLLFSATMPRDIAVLADQMLRDPVKVEVAAPATTAEKVDQWVLFVDRDNKRHLLAEMLKDPKMTRTLVFTRTKHGANRVTEQLSRMQVRAAAIHGNKSQGARQAALESFRAGHTRVLVATDIAARGIDVDGITHVVNYELPNEPESYVHRIGRTARAGARGIALSFCDREERSYLRDIERLTKQPLQVVADHPYRAAGGVQASAPSESSGGDRPRGGGHRPGGPRPQGRGGWRGGGRPRQAHPAQ